MENVFDGYEPIPGLENLGRHIRDKQGAPSGSYANFEALRGAADPSGLPTQAHAVETIAEMEAKLREAFGG